MALEQTWRWFGPKDPVTLGEIKQTGATGIVTALHHIPIGGIWTTDEILGRKNMIAAHGLRWSVAESIPVHEDIKKRSGKYPAYIENFKTSIRNLGKCGIDTVCYNFMPVLDWSRTDLEVVCADDAVTTKFESRVFTAFDLHILQRPGAEKEYTKQQRRKAGEYYAGLNNKQIERLTNTILLGLPGSLEAYSLEQFKSAVMAYQQIKDTELRDNLYRFIKEIIPVAEEAGVYMVLHPDDPPWSLLGLPRVVSNSNDIDRILRAVDSPANGLTLCTGSLGASIHNDPVKIVETFAHRINFIHLRNVVPNEDGDFVEDYHLNGKVDMFGVVKALLIEQKRRQQTERRDIRMPMRPDHGHLLIPEKNKPGIYPGYSLFGRMRGLAEIRGLEYAISRSLEN